MNAARRASLAAMLRGAHYVDLQVRRDGKTITIQADDPRSLLDRPEHPNDWNPQEALTAFCAHLSAEDTAFVVGAEWGVVPLIERLKEFCDRHGLDRPRQGWQNLIVPKKGGNLMAESNRVVEALKKLKELRAEETQAQQDAQNASARRSSATRGIEEILRQVEWGVGPNKPERAVSVDGVVFVIRFRANDAVSVEQLVVEGL